MGTVCVSLDTELGWGAIESDRWAQREKDGVYEKLRDDIQWLLHLLEQYEIPVTWAVVGGMLSGKHEVHLDHLPPEYKDKVWNCLTRSKRETFEGRDIFDRITESKVKHEVACHGYTHTRFDMEGTTNNFAKSEMECFAEGLANMHAISMVFPQNRVNFLDVISQSGIKVVRTGPLRGKLGKFNSLIPTRPPLSRSTKMENGITKVTGSLLLTGGEKRKWMMPIIRQKALNGIKVLSTRDGVLHYWCHPFNFSEMESMKELVVSLLKRIDDARDKGLVNTCLLSEEQARLQ